MKITILFCEKLFFSFVNYRQLGILLLIYVTDVYATEKVLTKWNCYLSSFNAFFSLNVNKIALSLTLLMAFYSYLKYAWFVLDLLIVYIPKFIWLRVTIS